MTIELSRTRLSVLACVLVALSCGGGSPTSPSSFDRCSIEFVGNFAHGDFRVVQSRLDAASPCTSPHGGAAEYYSINMLRAGVLDVIMSSDDVDSYLRILNGEGTSGAEIGRDDDGGTFSDARIVLDVASGYYTIEATSFSRGESGSYVLDIEVYQ